MKNQSWAQKAKKTAARSTAVALLLSLLSSAALAGSPFASGSSTLTNDILAIVTPIVGLAVIAVGVMCWFGKIAWMWFAGLIVGIVLVFGNSQIVSWIRSLFGV